MDEPSQINITAAVNKNIINYQNDSISIASVHSNGTSTSQITPVTSVANKISLVPTKLLLKSSTGFKSPPPLATATSTITTQSSSQSIPMKVVFVTNNAQQSAGKQQLITLNKAQAVQLQNHPGNKIIVQGQPTKMQLVNQLPSISAASSISPNSIAKVSVATSSHSHRHEPSECKKGKSSKSLLGSSKLPVIRSLLTNIVEIENQRLEIEKQRLEYEKKVGNEILTLLKSFMGSSNSNSAKDPTLN